MRENDIGLLAPDDDDDEPLLPQVRVAGFKLSSILIVVALVAGAFFGLRAFIHFSTDEVTRSRRNSTTRSGATLSRSEGEQSFGLGEQREPTLGHC